MRSGPKPLPIHIAMAQMAALGLAGGQVFDEMALRDYFRGIQKYQSHPFHRTTPPYMSNWQGGAARLFSLGAALDVSGHTAGALQKTPVVLVPSMVNGSAIFDLLPERSFLRWLDAHGFRVFLFDWGAPAQDTGQGTFADAVQSRLLPALQSLGRPVITVGYCMGGLFTAAAAALAPSLIRAMTLLATPWNFHDSKAYLKNRLMVMEPMLRPYLKQHTALPESWMQGVFATLDPEGTIRKFARFANEQDPMAEQLFIAVEDWLNEGVDLPAAIADHCVTDWYGANTPFAGTWNVAGMIIKAGDIPPPVLVIGGEDDRIVPSESAQAFFDQRQRKGDRLIIPKIGHIGLMAGAKAQIHVWKPIADWCALQQ